MTEIEKVDFIKYVKNHFELTNDNTEKDWKHCKRTFQHKSIKNDAEHRAEVANDNEITDRHQRHCHDASIGHGGREEAIDTYKDPLLQTWWRIILGGPLSLYINDGAEDQYLNQSSNKWHLPRS